MNKFYLYFLNKLKNLKLKLTPSIDSKNNSIVYDYSGQAASDFIEQILLSQEAVMIARFGSVELECLTIFYLKTKHSLLRNSYNYIKGYSSNFWWTETILRQMNNNAGFFPSTIKNLEKFSEMMLNDLKELDALGSWLSNEKYFDQQLKSVKKIKLSDIEPYYHLHPWTKALAGKKILVIHPYSKNISRQYKKREMLFKNKDILPEFHLLTIKAVQSIAGSNTEFNNWFEALDHMKEEINKTDFDIALIGCGAYGFCLAAHIKRMGKKSIHLGGATQILFGIKGKRWEEIDFFKELFNEHWTKPLIEETPINSIDVENGCYW